MKQINVQYFDTFRRTSFFISVDENLSAEELLYLLDDEVRKRGYAICETRQIYITGVIEPSLEEDKPFSGVQPLSVVYTNIVCPNNAQEFDRENGIQYFFHTEERNHLMNPHIHAKTDGSETMSFALNGTWIAGKFKSPSKAKEAKRYVKENHDIIEAAWNAVINRGYPLTRKEIESEKAN